MRLSFFIKLFVILIICACGLYFILPDYHLYLPGLFPAEYSHLILFYTNDMHGHIMRDPYNRIMGMAAAEFLINKNKKDREKALLVDIGDAFFGSNETDLNDGIPMVEIMNRMGYSAMAVGNHEYDFGREKTAALEKMAEFPMLSANLSADGKPMYPAYRIMEKDGIKIAFIGLSTEDTLTRTKPEYVVGMSVMNSIEALKTIVPQLRQECDILVLLAHEKIVYIKEILAAYPEIALAIGGHEHIALSAPIKYRNAYIVSSGAMLNHIGRVDIVFRNKKPVFINGKLLENMSKYMQDKTIEAIVTKYHDKIAGQLNVAIGKTEVNLTDFNRCRFEESNFGNVLTDAMREATGADIAFQNGGGIRTNISRGDITLYKIYEAFPFVNYVILVKMNGKMIKEALEQGLKGYPSLWNGGFPQVSGMTYTFDGAKPSGRRLVDAEIKGEPIDDDKEYTVATNDYLYQGGDGYGMIKKAELLYNTGLLIKDVFQEYVTTHKTINPVIEGRIIILNKKE